MPFQRKEEIGNKINLKSVSAIVYAINLTFIHKRTNPENKPRISYFFSSRGALVFMFLRLDSFYQLARTNSGLAAIFALFHVN